MIMPIGEFGTILADQGLLNNMRDDFSGRAGLWVNDISTLVFEETAIYNAPDNNDVDETKISGGKSIAQHM